MDDYSKLEKGGDGTFGEDTKEIMSLLKSCKRVLETKRSRLGKAGMFVSGDLVYDSRVEEHGIVLGERPILKHLGAQTKASETRSRIYIVLTITTDQETGELKTRIRYSINHCLRLIEENDKNSLSDLDIFCSSQCIQECSEDCVLYKYKRVPDEE